MSTGSKLSVESSLGIFNEAAFASIDWAVWAAKSYVGALSALGSWLTRPHVDRYGLRLIIPLTDQYDYYVG